MGQKVNPHGFRVGVIKDWDSRWYARNEKVGDLIVEDQKIRKFLKKTLYGAGVPKIEIERDNAKVRIFLHCARPGMVIGENATKVEALRQDVEKLIGKPVQLSIVEIRRNEVDTNTAAGEAYLLPPCHEEGHQQRHARRRQGHQGLRFRPSGRR